MKMRKSLILNKREDDSKCAERTCTNNQEGVKKNELEHSVKEELIELQEELSPMKIILR